MRMSLAHELRSIPISGYMGPGKDIREITDNTIARGLTYGFDAAMEPEATNAFSILPMIADELLRPSAMPTGPVGEAAAGFYEGSKLTIATLGNAALSGFEGLGSELRNMSAMDPTDLLNIVYGSVSATTQIQNEGEGADTLILEWARDYPGLLVVESQLDRRMAPQYTTRKNRGFREGTAYGAAAIAAIANGAELHEEHPEIPISPDIFGSGS